MNELLCVFVRVRSGDSGMGDDCAKTTPERRARHTNAHKTARQNCRTLKRVLASLPCTTEVGLSPHVINARDVPVPRDDHNEKQTKVSPKSSSRLTNVSDVSDARELYVEVGSRQASMGAARYRWRFMSVWISDALKARLKICPPGLAGLRAGDSGKLLKGQ